MEKKKSKIGLIIVLLLILILAGIAGGVYYYLKISAPKNVFVNQLNAYMGTSNLKNVEDIKQFNTTVSLSGNIETSNKDIAEYANIINNAKIALNVQTDFKRTMVGADIDYQNEKLIQAKAIYKEGDSNLYFFIQDLYDKYFRIKVDSPLSYYNSLELETNDLEYVDSAKAQEIAKSILIENLKDEYFYKENVDGLVKNTMKITVKEAETLITNIFTSLRDNEEYMNCFKNPSKAKEEFDNFIKIIPNLVKTIEEDINLDTAYVEISLYNKLFSNDIQKMEFGVKISENDEGKMILTKVNSDTYEFLFEIKTQTKGMNVTAEALKGSITIAKKDNETGVLNLVVDNVPEVGKVTLNMEVKYSEDINIDNVNTFNSVDFDNIPDSELIKVYTNLTKMKIYPFIASYYGY